MIFQEGREVAETLIKADKGGGGGRRGSRPHPAHRGSTEEESCSDTAEETDTVDEAPSIVDEALSKAPSGAGSGLLTNAIASHLFFLKCKSEVKPDCVLASL